MSDSPESTIRQQKPSTFAVRCDRGLRLAAFCGFGVLLVCTMSFHASLSTFLDVPSAAIAIVGPFLLLLAVFGWAHCRQAVAGLFRGAPPTADSAAAVGFFRLGAAFAIACGLGGTLVGTVLMLVNMADPAALGPAMALALLSQFYGVVLAVVFAAAAAWSAKRTGRSTALASLTSGLAPFAGSVAAIGVLSTLTLFLLLIIAMGRFVP